MKLTLNTVEFRIEDVAARVERVEQRGHALVIKQDGKDERAVLALTLDKPFDSGCAVLAFLGLKNWKRIGTGSEIADLGRLVCSVVSD